MNIPINFYESKSFAVLVIMISIVISIGSSNRYMSENQYLKSQLELKEIQITDLRNQLIEFNISELEEVDPTDFSREIIAPGMAHIYRENYRKRVEELQKQGKMEVNAFYFDVNKAILTALKRQKTWNAEPEQVGSRVYYGVKDPDVPTEFQEIVQLIYPINTTGEVIKISKEKVYMVCLPKLAEQEIPVSASEVINLDNDGDGIPDVKDIEPGVEPLLNNMRIINCPPRCD